MRENKISCFHSGNASSNPILIIFWYISGTVLAYTSTAVPSIEAYNSTNFVKEEYLKPLICKYQWDYMICLFFQLMTLKWLSSLLKLSLLWTLWYLQVDKHHTLDGVAVNVGRLHHAPALKLHFKHSKKSVEFVLNFF